MIELDRHIEILLLSNDCVIVPDLGGFMTHRVEARYDETDNTFIPPLRTLGFNPQLTMNDSLLVQSYVEAYDMSYPEALRRIEDEVSEMKQHLENEGTYELNDIGVLSLNEDGNYLFTPCEAGILTPDLYGLSSFQMKSLDKSAKKVADKIIVPDEETPATALPTEAVLEEDIEEVGEKAIIIKMSWIRNAVAIAAAILAFFLMTTPVTNSENSNTSIGNLNNSVLFGKLPKDSNMEKLDLNKIRPKEVIEEKKDSVAADTKAAVAKADSISAPKESTAPSYCIVLASYISKKNANIFVESLHKKGYNEAEVYIRNNVTRVVFGNYKTINEAYNQLNRMHRDKDFEEAWVLKVKDRS